MSALASPSGNIEWLCVCSFWLVSALTDVGEVARSRALCDPALSG
ncbi:MAG TPA: hypothetical protein VGH93_02180 [Solirubrobacteraceae bacterium]